jgi:hypothetical protein
MLKTQSPMPPHTTGHRGKEGEHDECFDLAAFSAPQREAFLSRVRKAVGDSKRVTLRENGPCRDDRRERGL